MRIVPPKRVIARTSGGPQVGAPVQVDYFQLSGGLDLETPPVSIKPGFCRDAHNYEIGVNGGYKTIQGYERFDGRARPSDAQYTVLHCTITGTIAVGNTVTGVPSSATGVVIAIESAAVIVTRVTGTFADGDALQVAAATQATMNQGPVIGGASTNQLNWQYLNLAADAYRSDIAVVPGSGPVRGVVEYGNIIYAFRNNAGGTACVMHKATASGWSAVTTPALNAGGSYQFAIYNFGSGDMLYGCDGANKAFQFDGTTFTQITTGMAVDTPNHIAGHKNHLFLVFDNSLQHSAIGNPLSWTPLLGAGELNIGQTVTNLMPQPGSEAAGALAVYGRNGTFMLYGTSSTDWNLVPVQADAGALAGTAQYLGQTFVLDDRGVTNLQTTSNFGNFTAASVSSLIRRLIAARKGRIACTGISRDKNQYRLFFGGKTAIYMTLGGGFMPMEFSHDVTCYWSGEDADGEEASYAGTDEGYVMQFDKGTSLDGDEIVAWIELAYNHIKSPRTKKRYRKAIIEVGGEGYGSIWLSASLGYASTEYEHVPVSEQIARLAAGNWDSGTWDIGVWDGRILAPSEFELGGTAENIAIRIAQASDYQPPLTFYGIVLHYSPRRIIR